MLMNEATREIRLTENQAKYLGAIELPEPLMQIVGAPPQRSFRLTSVQKDALVSILGDDLQRRGFDVDYKPTAEGSMAESIIDALTDVRA